MEAIIDTLLEDIRNNWDEEDLGAFLCNVYGMGCLDNESEKDPEINQSFLLMCGVMNPDFVEDYILRQIISGGVDFDLQLEIYEDGEDLLDY